MQLVTESTGPHWAEIQQVFTVLYMMRNVVIQSPLMYSAFKVDDENQGIKLNHVSEYLWFKFQKDDMLTRENNWMPWNLISCLAAHNVVDADWNQCVAK